MAAKGHVHTLHYHPQGWLLGFCYCNASRHQRYVWRVLLLAAGHQGHRGHLSPSIPSTSNALSFVPAKDSSKRTTVCITEKTTVPAASADILSQEIILHFSSPAQPFCSRPLANLQEECKAGTTAQSTAASKTQACDRRCNIGTAKGRNEAYCLLPLTPFPQVLATAAAHRAPRNLINPRAAMAKASDLTWGSDKKPQKLPRFRFQITTAPMSALAA